MSPDSLPLSESETMHVYVAGAVSRWQEAARVMQLFRDADCTITHDWTPPEDEFVDGVADRAYAGVRNSEIVVCLPGRIGSYIEVGLALAWEIPVLVVGDHHSAFFELPEVTKCSTAADAVAVVVRTKQMLEQQRQTR